MKSKRGFTFLEVLIAIIVISVGSALAVKPMKGLLQRMKLQNAANGMKHTIMNARLRAVANPARLCGVVFQPGSATKDHVVFAFLDKNPSDKIYKSGEDAPYLSPFVVRKEAKVAMTIPAGYPSVVVFRGDGSASASARVILAIGTYVDTLEILASTGRVRVGSK